MTDRTYDANGRRVSVPEDPDPTDLLADALKECLSPEAVAVIASYLQPARSDDDEIDRQIRWFADVLVETVGGDDAMNRLVDQLGL